MTMCCIVTMPRNVREKSVGTRLMKTVVSVDGKKTYLYPYKVYAYQSLKTLIRNIVVTSGISRNVTQNAQSAIECNV